MGLRGNQGYDRQVTSNIFTLVPDIKALLTRKDGWLTDELVREHGHFVADRLRSRYGATAQERRPTLRLSRMAETCPCQVWHSINNPAGAELIHPWTYNKWVFGDFIEAWALTLAKAAGHQVEGEQDELHVDGIAGHRDCVLDGAVCDVKSCTSHAIKDYEKGTLWQDDKFGYLEQLDGYICGSQQDPLVRIKDRGYILAIDKQMGHIALYEHLYTPEREAALKDRIARYKDIVRAASPPECRCGVEPYGESGNMGLDTVASYNSFKYCCFPNLRTFIYSKGPVYLTHVEKRPKDFILEVDRYNQPVYN